MKKLLSFLIILFINSPTFAAGVTYSSKPIVGVFSLSPKQIWTSNCIEVIPPFNVFVATVGAGSFLIRRFADKNCLYMIDVGNKLPKRSLIKDPLCFANSYCGDQGTPDLTPFMAIKVLIFNELDIYNTVIAVQLVQDPVDLKNKNKNSYPFYEDNLGVSKN